VRRLGVALLLACLVAVPAAAQKKPADFMRRCKRQDLIGLWRVMRLNVPRGVAVDRTDPAFLTHQRYVFHSNATMTYASQEVPFSAEEQRALLSAPTSATWAMDAEGRLVRQREGAASVEKADCLVIMRAVKESGTTQLTAQAGDVLLTDEGAGGRPAMRRLLRKVTSAD
jgi:hypothetical protein